MPKLKIKMQNYGIPKRRRDGFFYCFYFIKNIVKYRVALVIGHNSVG